MPPIDALKTIVAFLRGDTSVSLTAVYKAAVAILAWVGDTFLPAAQKRAVASAAPDNASAADAIEKYVEASETMYRSAAVEGSATGSLPDIFPILIPVILQILKRLLGV